METLVSKAAKQLEAAPFGEEERRHAELLLTNLERKETGNGLFKSEDYEQAIKVFREAYLDVSKIPWSENKKYYTDAMNLLEALRLNLAASHTKLGNFDRALEFCNRAIELKKPDANAKAFYRRGMAYEGLQNYEAAQADLKFALERKPGDTDIQRVLDRVNAALEAIRESAASQAAKNAEKERKKKQKQRKKQEADAARQNQLEAEKRNKQLVEEEARRKRTLAAEEAERRRKEELEQQAKEAKELEMRKREEQRAADKRRAAEEKARKRAEEKAKQEERERKRKEKQLAEARAYEAALQQRARELEEQALEKQMRAHNLQPSSGTSQNGSKEAAARERQRQVLAQLQKGAQTSGSSASSMVESSQQLLKNNGRPYTPPLDASSRANGTPPNFFPSLNPSLDNSQKDVVPASSNRDLLEDSWEASQSAWADTSWDAQEDGSENPNWNITGQDEQGCVICMERDKNALLLPCGHLSACMQCIELVKKSTKPLCPICRQPIEDVIQIGLG